jgi:hypothetical protein
MSGGSRDAMFGLCPSSAGALIFMYLFNFLFVSLLVADRETLKHKATTERVVVVGVGIFLKAGFSNFFSYSPSTQYCTTVYSIQKRYLHQNNPQTPNIPQFGQSLILVIRAKTNLVIK